MTYNILRFGFGGTLMQENNEREKIIANLYDEIDIIIDYTGLTDKDIVEKALDIDALLENDRYIKNMSPLTYDEIEQYSKRQRRELSLAAKRNSIEEENAVRYLREDSLVEVVIYRTFTQIKLNYNDSTKHVLRDYFSVVLNFATCLNEDRPFFKIQTVFLQKKNKVFGTSIYQIFQCFEKDRFGTFIQGTKNDLYNLDFLNGREVFSRDDLEFEVQKLIGSGMDVNTKKRISIGQLDIIGRYDVAPIEEFDIVEKLGRLNDGIYDIFRRYLKDSFLEDMINGTTKKLVGGFHS